MPDYSQENYLWSSEQAVPEPDEDEDDAVCDVCGLEMICPRHGVCMNGFCPNRRPCPCTEREGRHAA